MSQCQVMPLLLTLVFLALGIACLTVRLHAMKGHVGTHQPRGDANLGALFFKTDRQREKKLHNGITDFCKFIVTSQRLICLFCSNCSILVAGALFLLFQCSIFLLQVLYFCVQVFYFSCPGALFDCPPPPRGLAPQSLPCSQHGEALFVNCSTRIRHVVQRDSSPYLFR